MNQIQKPLKENAVKAIKFTKMGKNKRKISANLLDMALNPDIEQHIKSAINTGQNSGNPDRNNNLTQYSELLQAINQFSSNSAR